MRQYYTPKLLPRPSPTLLTCAHKYCAVSQSTHVAFISTVLHPNWNRQQAAMHRHDQRAPSTDPGKGKFHIHHHFRVIILQGGEQLPSQVLCLACRTLACLVHQKFTKVIVQITAFSRLPPPHWLLLNDKTAKSLIDTVEAFSSVVWLNAVKPHAFILNIAAVNLRG